MSSKYILGMLSALILLTIMQTNVDGFIAKESRL